MPAGHTEGAGTRTLIILAVSATAGYLVEVYDFFIYGYAAASAFPIREGLPTFRTQQIHGRVADDGGTFFGHRFSRRLRQKYALQRVDPAGRYASN
jgi:hypothetical protein